jgi:hypothetical protein
MQRVTIKQFLFPATLIVLLIVGLRYPSLHRIDNNQSGDPTTSEPTGRATTRDRWVTVSYANLLPQDTVVRTGESLSSALRDSSLRNAVQPFVDGYSELLPSVLEMINGPDKTPHHNVVDYFPAGAPQPAWVGILRGGRIYISTDDEHHAKVFLLGDDPERCYKENYSVIRHCLAMLLRHAQGELEVDTFAYHNDYQTSELRINTIPYSLRATSFDSDKTNLDLDGLADFFAQGPELRGAAVNKNKGLTLYGCASERQTLAGKPVELADLAVAYRAAFHAGDNEAFISLDPHKDPTKVTVNFGGFLENTRIGSVVLEADKRFKTITSGLDPSTFLDRRAYTRTHVPSFLSSAERDLLYGDTALTGKWIGTRFWYYPDAIGVDSDLQYEYAVITNPRFTADAERSREDFASLAVFNQKKNETLSPSIRDNINDLNRNYMEYVGAFPEIAELQQVARLMGICSWLFKAAPSYLDCDDLLAVQLPACETESERTQLLAATYLTISEAERPERARVTEDSTLVFLTPILDKTVAEFFQTPANVEKYLSGTHDEAELQHSPWTAEATRLFEQYQQRKVREMVDSKEALKKLADYAASAVQPPEPTSKSKLDEQIELGKQVLAQLETKITRLKRQLEQSPDVYSYNSLVDMYTRLVGQYELVRQNLNTLIRQHNAMHFRSSFIVEISGGINLESSKFAIRQQPSSPSLIKLKEIAKVVQPQWTRTVDAEKWICSKTSTRPARTSRFDPPDISTNAQQIKRLTTAPHSDNGSWSEAVKLNETRSQEKSYNAQKQQIQIAKFSSGRVQDLVVGRRDSDGRIIFERSDRTNVIPKDF